MTKNEEYKIQENLLIGKKKEKSDRLGYRATLLSPTNQRTTTDLYINYWCKLNFHGKKRPRSVKLDDMLNHS